MEKRAVNPASMAKPVGYSHAVCASGGRVLFLAGQVGADSAGKIKAPGDMVAQFSDALANLQTVVEESGGTMTDIVKLTMYVTDRKAYRSNLKAIGDVYRSRFGRHYPAMTFVEVKSLFDDNIMIEIDGMAVFE